MLPGQMDVQVAKAVAVEMVTMQACFMPHMMGAMVATAAAVEMADAEEISPSIIILIYRCQLSRQKLAVALVAKAVTVVLEERGDMVGGIGLTRRNLENLESAARPVRMANRVNLARSYSCQS